MIYIALPAMDEELSLPRTLGCIAGQSYADYKLVVCINQPESYRILPDKQPVVESNRRMLEYIGKYSDKRILLLDRSSEGKGWPIGGHGIGAARKYIMDLIASSAKPEDIIVSMDADTEYNQDFLQSIFDNFLANPEARAISVPYYHKLTGNMLIDRPMLRYEIYMRSYALNMWRIQNPYCFTALGSAMAFPVWAYKAVGGLTAKLSGEDFYFLQKLTKSGLVLHWNAESAYPSARFSDRVFFGTGPALIKGAQNDWESYPVYHPSLFDLVDQTCKLFGQLYLADVQTPMDEFLIQKSSELPWPKLRRNFKDEKKFIRACYEKIDGLRILQFLKERQPENEETGIEALSELFFRLMKDGFKLEFPAKDRFSFTCSPIDLLDQVRNQLHDAETVYRHRHWGSCNTIKRRQ